MDPLTQIFSVVNAVVLYDPRSADALVKEPWVQKPDSRLHSFPRCMGVAPLTPMLFKGQMCIYVYTEREMHKAYICVHIPTHTCM